MAIAEIRSSTKRVQMSIGALSTNAATSAQQASQRLAIPARATGPRTDPVDPLSPSAKAERQGGKLYRYRAPDEQGQENKSDRARAAGRSAPAHLRVVPAQRPDTSPSTLFIAQMLSQDGPQSPKPGLPGIGHALDGQRDAAALGSQHYRMTGAEPQVLGANATLLSISV
jgi:hypothetical protein